MKRLLLLLLLLPAAVRPSGAYTDHRGHNVDSLERAVARWTPDAVDRATPEELKELNRAYRDLMLGYELINGEKSFFYACKAIAISRKMGWEEATCDAARHIGQHYYAREQYDSAMVCYREALACTDRMAGGAYSEESVDDARSALYGTIGNLYNMMGDIPTALEYYSMAGEIFDRYGWNESNSILYYNIGETWLEEKDYGQALPAYEKALDYARAADDSLLTANALKGLGALYLETGKTRKALRSLQKADEYYSLHDDQEFRARLENLDFMSRVLREQKSLLAGGLVLSVLILAMLAAVIIVLILLRRVRKEQAETAEVMDETLKELQPVPASGGPSLTQREKEILALLSGGHTARDIAEALHLSPETIKWYRKKLLVKFDVANTPELVSKAKDLGLA